MQLYDFLKNLWDIFSLLSYQQSWSENCSFVGSFIFSAPTRNIPNVPCSLRCPLPCIPLTQNSWLCLQLGIRTWGSVLLLKTYRGVTTLCLHVFIWKTGENTLSLLSYRVLRVWKEHVRMSFVKIVKPKMLIHWKVSGILYYPTWIIKWERYRFRHLLPMGSW